MDAQQKLAGKVALVTGSSRGIGRAVAQRLASAGATVVVTGRSLAAPAAGKRFGQDQIVPGTLEETVSLIQAAGGKALPLAADLEDPAQRDSLIERAAALAGGLDILVNNAGTTRDTLLMTMKEDDWDVVINTNLRSVYTVSKAAIRSMIRQKWGRIINITSVVGLSGQGGQANYAASKAGIIGFTKSLAREVASRNITVNAVAPGFIPTALTDVLTEEQKSAILSNTPVGRMGTPEEVAWAVAFLATERASFITGHVLSVDGGLVMA